MKTTKVWSEAIIPFEAFKMGTKGGAVIFQIPTGDYKDWEFVRPLSLVRKSYEKGRPGFTLAYSIEQTVNDAGDVEGETPETLHLRKSAKGDDGKYSVIDEMDIPISELENLF